MSAWAQNGQHKWAYLGFLNGLDMGKQNQSHIEILHRSKVEHK